MPKVLYIEDDRSSSVLFEMLMETLEGVELFMAGNAEDGLEIAAQETPDFVFLDINLPGMDGITALSEMRTRESLNETRMIALSANAMPDQVNRAKLAGFDHYITKPYLLEEITSIVTQDVASGV